MTASLTERPLTPRAALPQAQAQAGVRALNLPPIEHGLTYLAAFGWGAARSLWNDHHLSSEDAPACSAGFTLSPQLLHRWHAFFRTDPTRGIPYLFAQGAATLLQRQLICDLGLNLRRVNHLRQTTHHVRGAEPQAQVPHQSLTCRLLRVCQLASGKLLVATETRICSGTGQTLAMVEDHHAVDGVDTATLPHPPRDRMVMAEHAQLLHRTAQIPQTEANVGEWVIGDDWGRRYATLSGELSPEYLGDLGARLAGQAQATLQFSALRNLVVRQLADVGLMPEHLDIQRCRPLSLGQRILIVQRDAAFEVLSQRGELLAFGTC